jgi:hypothetical protein
MIDLSGFRQGTEAAGNPNLLCGQAQYASGGEVARRRRELRLKGHQ